MKKISLILGALMISAPAYAHDYSYDAPSGNTQNASNGSWGNHTIQDCVHGATGTDIGMDCTRNRADRSVNDTSAYNTASGRLDGSHIVHSEGM